MNMNDYPAGPHRWAAPTSEQRIAALEAELERERMRLAACGVVALSDTPESAAKAREMHADYRSAACDDVARRVDECVLLRTELAQARAECERLTKDRDEWAAKWREARKQLAELKFPGMTGTVKANDAARKEGA